MGKPKLTCAHCLCHARGKIFDCADDSGTFLGRFNHTSNTELIPLPHFRESESVIFFLFFCIKNSSISSYQSLSLSWLGCRVIRTPTFSGSRTPFISIYHPHILSPTSTLLPLKPNRFSSLTCRGSNLNSFPLLHPCPSSLNDLGLETFSLALLFTRIFIPTSFLLVCILHLHYFHDRFLQLTDLQAVVAKEESTIYRWDVCSRLIDELSCSQAAVELYLLES